MLRFLRDFHHLPQFAQVAFAERGKLLAGLEVFLADFLKPCRQFVILRQEFRSPPAAVEQFVRGLDLLAKLRQSANPAS